MEGLIVHGRHEKGKSKSNISNPVCFFLQEEMIHQEELQEVAE